MEGTVVDGSCRWQAQGFLWWLSTAVSLWGVAALAPTAHALLLGASFAANLLLLRGHLSVGLFGFFPFHGVI
jgi:hypothetical protein